MKKIITKRKTLQRTKITKAIMNQIMIKKLISYKTKINSPIEGTGSLAIESLVEGVVVISREVKGNSVSMIRVIISLAINLAMGNPKGILTKDKVILRKVVGVLRKGMLISTKDDWVNYMIYN
jgi:hypothetical protein